MITQKGMNSIRHDEAIFNSKNNRQNWDKPSNQFTQCGCPNTKEGCGYWVAIEVYEDKYGYHKRVKR